MLGRSSGASIQRIAIGPPRKKRQLSRHARGYTNAHVARRRQLEPHVAAGQSAAAAAANSSNPASPGISTTETTAAVTSDPHTQPATSAPPQRSRTAREKTIR